MHTASLLSLSTHRAQDFLHSSLGKLVWLDLNGMPSSSALLLLKIPVLRSDGFNNGAGRLQPGSTRTAPVYTEFCPRRYLNTRHREHWFFTYVTYKFVRYVHFLSRALCFLVHLYPNQQVLWSNNNMVNWHTQRTLNVICLPLRFHCSHYLRLITFYFAGLHAERDARWETGNVSLTNTTIRWVTLLGHRGLLMSKAQT